MNISIYDSVKSNKPFTATWQLFLDVTEHRSIQQLALGIRQAIAYGDNGKKDELKRKLPIITWQAAFKGARKNNEAEPTGLFMLDVDHLQEAPETVYATKVAGKLTECGIVAVHKTISCQGLRVVAFCRPEFKTLAENQRWLANELMLDFDSACKDWARSSFLVPFEYFFNIKGEIFDPDFKAPFVLPVTTDNTSVSTANETNVQSKKPTGQKEYKGLPLYDIAIQWLKNEKGGLPQEGERNMALFHLAVRMKYITDFNPYVIADNIPHCGLSDAEVLQLCTSACSGQRAMGMPRDMAKAINDLQPKTEETIELPPVIANINSLPPLPPVFSDFVSIAPDDFKQAVILVLLPMLGTLGSKLRAKYLNNTFETPSFNVALEAPQASGKSFIEDVYHFVMQPIKELDDKERENEKEYDEMIKTRKAAGTGTKGERAELRELMERKPRPIIRLMPATASITKLLIRMDNADGLHLFALAVEIDTVQKAFKRGFSNLSDLLRCAFDNAEYGQEYATDTSFSGKVNVFYNTLYSGTPAAMRRFYTNSEDGTMSRTLFVTLPDQFGKKMPVWGKMEDGEKVRCKTLIESLCETSIKGREVQMPYVMNLDYLNESIAQWIENQRQLSVKYLDRTRNVFYRRCAETAFRAGMLAHWLYGMSPDHHNDVCKFSIWVADMMLSQFLMRVNINNDDEEIGNLFARQVYAALDKEFTRTQLESKLVELGFRTPVRNVIWKWKQADKIDQNVRFGAELFVKKIQHE